MRPIRSIVVFNSATAGDFLTSLCWSQLQLPSELFQQEDSGRMNVNNGYFKNLTTRIFYDSAVPAEFDPARVFPVENSHYWLECYKTIADRLVFIDYPEQVQQHIMQVYLEKVFDNDRQKMLERNLPHQNPYIARKITVDNIEQVLNIHWQKNIRAWRDNPDLSAIHLADFFDRDKMQRIVGDLIDQDLTDSYKFDQIYNNWIQRNSKLASLF
jgi:hypothetical protein